MFSVAILMFVRFLIPPFRLESCGWVGVCAYVCAAFPVGVTVLA